MSGINNAVIHICELCVSYVSRTEEFTMSNVTVSVPEELKSKMEELRTINWSEVAKEAFAKTVELSKQFEKFKKIVSKSKLT